MNTKKTRTKYLAKECVKPKGIIMEVHVNAKHSITDQLVSSIFKKLLENNMLPPKEEFIQHFLNTVVNAIDTVIDKIEAEDDSEQETKH